MTLQAASHFRCPPPPTLLTPHRATTTARPPPPGTRHHPVRRERTSDLSIATARSFLPSAAIGLYLPRPCLYRHTSASLLCFAQIDTYVSRVSLSFIITSCMMTSWDYFRRQRTSFNRGQPALWRERLSPGRAERRPGAGRLKICVRTLLLPLYLSACRRWLLLDNGGNAGCLHYFCTRKQADLLRRHIHVRDFVLELTFSVRIFSEKTYENSWKFLQVILLTEKSMKILTKFE